MNKQEAIKLLNSEGWTKADAQRALKVIDFKTNQNIDELTIRRAASQFAGSELIQRQRLQAAQKSLVTKKNQEIQNYILKIQELEKNQPSPSDSSIINSDLQKQLEKVLKDRNKLIEANNELKKDNKDLKNIVDAIRLKLTIETKHLLEVNHPKQIKQGLVKLLKSTLG